MYREPWFLPCGGLGPCHTTGSRKFSFDIECLSFVWQLVPNMSKQTIRPPTLSNTSDLGSHPAGNPHTDRTHGKYLAHSREHAAQENFVWGPWV